VLGCEHAPPTFVGVSAHCPVLGLQKPIPQSVEPHADVPVMKDVPAWQNPERHPVPHCANAGKPVNDVRLFVTSHRWHALPGLKAPFAYTTPPTTHELASHDPSTQSPVAHAVPFVRGDHAVRSTPGWQLLHGSSGFTASAWYSTPPMKQTSGEQPPATQYPSGQAIPSVTGV
jgi:hypothetical protein